MDINTLLTIVDPVTLISWVITIGVSAVLYSKHQMLKDILQASQELAILLVAKSRITADGVITTDESNEAVRYCFTFLNSLENIFKRYILNRPETGWIRGYIPTVIEQLAKADQLAQNEKTVQTTINNAEILTEQGKSGLP